MQTDAVQDPCLRSSDPQCHEKNRDKYHPYLGYAPGAGRAAPVGATSAAPAGGVVGEVASDDADPDLLGLLRGDFMATSCRVIDSPASTARP